MTDANVDETSTPEVPPKRRKRRIALWVALGVVVALVAAVGVYAIRLQGSADQVERVEEAFPDESVRPAPYEGVGDAPLNYLLLGSDTRGEGESLLSSLGDRADTILVVHVPPDRLSVQIMSIMRDSWVSIPGYGDAKVNAALAYGGVPLMVQVVEQLIGQRIDDVAIIDFEGFTELTDAVGGVTVQNETAFEASGHTFEQGQITLTGEQALPYVRERYAFSDGDYQRVRNQQAYLRGLLSAVLQPSVLANPLTVGSLVDAMAPHMATTDGLTTSAALSLGSQFVGTGMPEISTFTLPTSGTGMVGGQSVVFLDMEGVALVQQAFQQESMSDFVPPSER